MKNIMYNFTPQMEIVNPKFPKVSYYRDYGKDIKDLLSKNYARASVWSIESQFKGPKGILYLNPAACSDGKLSAAVEYAFPDLDAFVKVRVTSESDLEAAGSIAESGHRAEMVLNRNGKHKISHECIIQERFASHESITDQSMEVGFGIKAHSLLQVGCGASYAYAGKKEWKWTTSARMSNSVWAANICVGDGELLNIGMIAPVKIDRFLIDVAGEVALDECKNTSGAIGIEVGSVITKGDSIKVRINKNFVWAVSYITKVADSWMAALTLDRSLRLGVTFTHYS